LPPLQNWRNGPSLPFAELLQTLDYNLLFFNCNVRSCFRYFIDYAMVLRARQFMPGQECECECEFELFLNFKPKNVRNFFQKLIFINFLFFLFFCHFCMNLKKNQIQNQIQILDARHKLPSSKLQFEIYLVPEII
jgi:hypothetical protein